MNASTYITKDGETLDYICWKVYGRTEGVLEQVLDNNSGLASLGPIYSAGTKIELPLVAELEETAPKSVSILWS